jgi:RNA polymerase sigma-70 factor (ECF subfamily)
MGDQAVAGAESEATDSWLVSRMIEGDREALAVLYDRHAGRVYRVALRLVGDAGAAEEVVQETMLALWDRAELFDPALASLGSWLAAIARNRAVDRLRYQGRRIAAQPLSAVGGRDSDDAEAPDRALEHGMVLAGAQQEVDPAAAGEAAWLRGALASAVATLPEPEREVIRLAYGGDLSQSEIAARLGWPLGTVKTRTRRALGVLRGMLAESMGPERAAAGATAPMARRTPARPWSLSPCPEPCD